jgi:hypothetical protein
MKKLRGREGEREEIDIEKSDFLLEVERRNKKTCLI